MIPNPLDTGLPVAIKKIFVSGMNPKIRFGRVGSDAINGRFCEWRLSQNDGRLSPTRYLLEYNMRPSKRHICECDGTQKTA